MRDVLASVVRPLKELKAFHRFSLRRGEKRTLSFLLDVKDLALHDAEMQRVVEPGEIEIMLGSSSGDIRLRGTLDVV